MRLGSSHGSHVRARQKSIRTQSFLLLKDDNKILQAQLVERGDYLSWLKYRRSKKTEEKAKVIAAVWGALDIFHQDDFEKRDE